jgi:hypothetical protein
MRKMARCLAVAVFGLPLGCSSSSGSAAVADAAAQDAGAESSTGTFGSSACGQCVDTACQQTESSCASDSGCASYLECLRACPTEASGNVQPACASACAMPSGSSAMLAQAYETCRTSGPGAACKACGTTIEDSGTVVDAGMESSILNEQCNPAMADDSSACNYCMTTQCCQVRTALYAVQSDFEAFASCALGCAMDAGASMQGSCLQACTSAHPQAFAAYPPDQACQNVDCYQECPPTPTACDVCRDTKCRDSYAACESEPDCWAILFCIGNGGSEASCQAAFPGGVTAENDFGTCAVTNCESSCSM